MKEVMITINNYLAQYKSIFYILLFFSIIAAFLEAVGLSLIIPIVNDLLINNESVTNPKADFIVKLFNPEYKFFIFPTLLIIVFFIKTIISMLNTYLTSYLSWTLRQHYALKLMEKFLHGDYKNILKNQIGSVINTVLTETTRASQCIRYFSEYITKSILLLGLIILLLINNFYLTIVISIIFIVLAFLLKSLIKNFAKSIGEKRILLSGQHTEECTQMIGSIKETKILGLHEILLNKFDIAVNGYSKVNIIFSFFSTIPNYLSEFLLVLLFATTIMLLYFFNYEISSLLTTLTMFFLVSIRLSQTASSMINMRIKYISYLESLNQVVFNIDKEYQEERNTGDNIKKINKNIKFKNIGFEYVNNLKILEDINLTIEKNKLIGIVGESGSGKSTLINILTCLLIPTEGEIYVDEKKLESINIKKWRNIISYVSQSPYLFNDTIYNNIVYGNINASREEIIEACKAAKCYEFILKLQYGFDTIVGDRGNLLSGGQLQRVAIARAILRKPSLYIFDECTSALDNQTEKSIVEIIETLANNSIVIIISHKKEILKNANNIYQIQNKKILEIKLNQI